MWNSARNLWPKQPVMMIWWWPWDVGEFKWFYIALNNMYMWSIYMHFKLLVRILCSYKSVLHSFCSWHERGRSLQIYTNCPLAKLRYTAIWRNLCHHMSRLIFIITYFLLLFFSTQFCSPFGQCDSFSTIFVGKHQKNCVLGDEWLTHSVLRRYGKAAISHTHTQEGGHQEVQFQFTRSATIISFMQDIQFNWMLFNMTA